MVEYAVLEGSQQVESHVGGVEGELRLGVEREEDVVHDVFYVFARASESRTVCQKHVCMLAVELRYVVFVVQGC